MTDVYTVFEGGGVKGIGLVGALSQLEREIPDLNILGYAGASAGAIVAALSAVGYPAVSENGEPSLKSILDELDLLRFLDGLQEIPASDLEQLEEYLTGSSGGGEMFDSAIEVLEELQNISESGWLGQKYKWMRLGKRLAKKASGSTQILAQLINVLHRLRDHWGLYDTKTFRTWIAQHLEATPHANYRDSNGHVTFGSLANQGVSLKVVAAGIEERRIETFDVESYSAMEVADAVLASMSLPGFFCPVKYFRRHFVDGGVISNFPAWLFDDEYARHSGSNPVPPLIGLRLVPSSSPAKSLEHVVDYAFAVARTIQDGPGFLQTRNLPSYVPIDIMVPKEIKATSFHLEDRQKEDLFENGITAAENALVMPAHRIALGLDESAGYD